MQRSVTRSRRVPLAMFLLCAPALLAQAPRGPGGPGGPPPPPPPPTAGAKLEILPGSNATYRVTEQLAGIDFNNDAVGVANVVSGTMEILPDGSIAPGSKLVVDMKSIKSDQDMRDNYIRNRTLETDKFPDAVFVPTKIEGVPKMVPTTGQVGVRLYGNMTIHGVTHPVMFQGIATLDPRGSTVNGIAKTEFKFADFNLQKPSLARLLSVEDTIRLELQFRFKRS